MQPSTDWLVYSPSTLINSSTESHIVDMVIKHYQSSLLANEQARQFLEDICGLNDERVFERYKLGFIDRTLVHKLGMLNTYEGESVRGLLQRKGLMKPNGHETFLGMVFVPIFGSSGDLIGGYGHRISKYVSRNVSFEDWFTQHPATLFNEEALNGTSSVILCDNLFDVLCLHEVGIDNAVALLGFKQFCDAHVNLFIVRCITCIAMAFSRTAQGDRYSAIVHRKLVNAGIKVIKLQLKTGESIHSLYAKTRWFGSVSQEIEMYFASDEGGVCRTLLH